MSLAVMGVMAAAAAGGTAQQVLEIDLENGRDIINDDRRAISLWSIAFDHARGILYATDLEEPEGVMAFSLATGDRLRTYQIRRGEGPRELSHISILAAASTGGLYALGGRKVLRFDSVGGFIGYWHTTPTISPRTLCEFGGQPTIVVQGGLRRHALDGTSEYIGSRLEAGEKFASRIEDGNVVRIIPQGQERRAEVVRRKLARSRLACTPDVAYLVFPNEEGPDSIVVYDTEGEVSRLTAPEHPRDRWSGAGLDGHGNLVLLSGSGRVPGAIIDPESGCHGVLRNRENQLHRELMGIHSDSALVFHRDRLEETRQGQKVVTLYAEARQISLHPIRRVSGEPCPGMLPSVNDSPALGN